MSTHQSQHLKRTNLFLLRVWTEDAGDSASDGSGNAAGSDSGKAEWHGKVQRVVDGESHQFNNWQDLIDLLLEMLSGATDGPE